MTKELAIRILRGDVLGTDEQTHEAVFMAIRTLKTEPIIRCDKCRHWQDEPSKGKNPRFHECMFFLYPTTANDCCSKAIRKIDEVEE